MILFIFLTIVWLHFAGDFVLQTNAMANNKAFSLKWLGIHVVCYTAPWLILGWQYAAVNGILHGLVDFCTSKLRANSMAKGKIRPAYMVLGADQALHLTCLMTTLPYFGNATLLVVIYNSLR